MTNIKYTKKDKFNALITLLADADQATEVKEGLTVADLVEFAQHEVELLSRKSVSATGEKKLTERQKENLAIGDAVVDAMEPTMMYTITQLMKEVPNLPADMTNQRLTHIVSDLVKDERVVKVVDKRVSYFRLP